MAETKNFEIIVDDGSQRVPIKNKYGDEIGVFYFHPTDIGIIERFNNIADEFDKIVEPLENISIEADGTAADMAEAKALKEAENRLYKAVNFILGGDVSKAFFGAMNPFSPVGGMFYCEVALNAIGQYISDQFKQETSKYSKRVEKYTKKYMK